MGTKFKRIAPPGMAILQRQVAQMGQAATNISSQVTTIDSRVTKLELASGISTKSVTMYVCPPVAENSYTYTDEAKTTKLVGSDTDGDGTIGHPFASINKAIQILKQYRAGASITFQILLHAGIYKSEMTGMTNASGNYVSQLKNGGANFRIEHVDVNPYGGCRVEMRGVMWSGHVIDSELDQLDNTHVFGDGTALRCPVVLEYTTNYGAPSGDAPFHALCYCDYSYIKFKIKPTNDEELNMFPYTWGVHMYNGSGSTYRFCKFIDMPQFSCDIKDPASNNATAAIEYCYFDNSFINRKTTTRPSNGIPRGRGFEVNSTLTSSGFFCKNLDFNWMYSCINANQSFLYFQGSPIVKKSTTENSIFYEKIIKVYNESILRFVNCMYSGIKGTISGLHTTDPNIPGYLCGSDIEELSTDATNDDKKIRDTFYDFILQTGNAKNLYIEQESTDETGTVVDLEFKAHGYKNNGWYKYTNLTVDPINYNVPNDTVLVYKENDVIKYKRGSVTMGIPAPIYDDTDNEISNYLNEMFNATNFPVEQVLTTDQFSKLPIKESHLPALINFQSVYATLHGFLKKQLIDWTFDTIS